MYEMKLRGEKFCLENQGAKEISQGAIERTRVSENEINRKCLLGSVALKRKLEFEEKSFVGHRGTRRRKAAERH